MTLDELVIFIREELLNDPSATFEVDEDLLLSGRLDSLSVMRLVAHIQGSLDIQIPPEDIVLENFGSLARIQAYLASIGTARGSSSGNQ